MAHSTRRVTWCLVTSLALSLVLGVVGLLRQTQPVQASPPEYPLNAGVVSACNEANLLAALTGGGIVTFSTGDCIITLSASILISAPTTIDGTGQSVTLSGGDARRIITTTTGVGTLTLQNITLARGRAVGLNEHGGAAFVRGHAVLSNVTIISNTSVNASGGGVYVTNSLTLTNAQFISNTAGSSGGGAYGDGAANVKGGQFYNNRSLALNFGGGLYANNTLMLADTIFLSNMANLGGGVFANGAIAQVNGALFQSNNGGSAGGGLYALNALMLTGTQFLSNTTSGTGGGLFAVGATQVEGGLFLNNRSTSNSGGGLYVNNRLTLTGTQFFSNTAQIDGGGGYVVSATQASGVLFQYNRSIANHAGGLRVNGALTLTNTQFISNTASSLGGGALVLGAVQASGGRFEDNSANSAGGLYAGNALTISGTHFVSNTARIGDGGGAHVLDVARLNGGLIQNNRAGNWGGGMRVDSAFTLTDTVFISNTAGGSAGGAYAGGVAQLNGGLFQNNQSTSTFSGNGGGGLYAVSTLTLSGTQFISNTALEGGGLRAVIARLNQGLFQNNSASADGGGITVLSALTGTGTQFLNNSAGNNGGGIMAYNTFELTGTLFVSNLATQGGSVYHVFGAARVVNSLFARNAVSSTRGAGLYLSSPGNVQILHSTLVSPSLASDSAIYVENGTVGITNTIIASYTIGISQTLGTVFEDYNLFFGNGTNLAGAITSGGNSIAGAPAFVAPASDNYHLALGSAAIDVGVNAGVASDFEGDTRPSGAGFEIGFDEATAISGLSATNSSPTPLGSATAFTASIVTGGGVSYVWNFGDGTGVVASATPTHIYATLGNFTATVTATNGLGSVVATTLVTITDAPIVGLVAVNSSPTVLGNATNFTATLGAGTNVTYTWNFGDGSATMSGMTTTHAYAAVGAYTATVTAANGLGSVVATTWVTITDVPISGLSATNNSPTVLGSVTNFTATISTGGNVSYVWNFGDGSATTSGATVTRTYMSVGNYTAMVTATNSAGSVVATTPVTITATGTPITGLSITGSVVTPTIGSGVTFTATTTGGSGPISYAWSVSGPVTANGTGNPFSFSFPMPGTYTVTVTATNSIGAATTGIVVFVPYRVYLPLAIR